MTVQQHHQHWVHLKWAAEAAAVVAAAAAAREADVGTGIEIEVGVAAEVEFGVEVGVAAVGTVELALIAVMWNQTMFPVQRLVLIIQVRATPMIGDQLMKMQLIRLQMEVVTPHCSLEMEVMSNLQLNYCIGDDPLN